MGVDGLFHVVLVYNTGEEDIGARVLARLHSLPRGYRRFAIHVISPAGKPHYIGRIRGLISNNIAFTLSISWRGGSVEDLRRVAREVRGKPHIALIAPDMAEYRRAAIDEGLKVEDLG